MFCFADAGTHAQPTDSLMAAKRSVSLHGGIELTVLPAISSTATLKGTRLCRSPLSHQKTQRCNGHRLQLPNEHRVSGRFDEQAAFAFAPPPLQHHLLEQLRHLKQAQQTGRHSDASASRRCRVRWLVLLGARLRWTRYRWGAVPFTRNGSPRGGSRERSQTVIDKLVPHTRKNVDACVAPSQIG